MSHRATDFDDCQRQVFPTRVTAREAYHLMTASPPPAVRFLFGLRDALGKIVGIKPIEGFSSQVHPSPSSTKLDFFDVDEDYPERLILSSTDHHLKVIIAICVEEHGVGSLVSVTASVDCNNFVGHLYMLPVRPIHKVMTSWMLKQAALTSER
ncbi:DUF2867 domain-containing protein [Acetobacter sp. P5B1]|uniref:DUF2867 domain-containing protein n=1 Tax=Acetobacter sp. P5B1 TaxID=2762620 RepID=UPI001C04BAC1|nr:DUF2867 domain-containing protein [Acetobacter sp. P5B1]